MGVSVRSDGAPLWVYRLWVAGSNFSGEPGSVRYAVGQARERWGIVTELAAGELAIPAGRGAFAAVESVEGRHLQVDLDVHPRGVVVTVAVTRTSADGASTETVLWISPRRFTVREFRRPVRGGPRRAAASP